MRDDAGAVSVTRGPSDLSPRDVRDLLEDERDVDQGRSVSGTSASSQDSTSETRTSRTAFTSETPSTNEESEGSA